MPQISVIVPVYKVEDYLSDCIDSILAQTFEDFELILVDDGSPDNCGAICDAYAQKDRRIKVIHQENQGLSGARNSGMDIAQGEYLTFVDSDDLVHRCYLKMLLDAMDSETDITVCSPVEFENETELEAYKESEGKTTNLDANCAVIALYNGSKTMPMNACGKLFRTTLLSKIRFPVGRLHEDQMFTPLVCYRARKIVSCSAALYYYRERSVSITRDVFSVKRYDDLWAIDSCIRFFESKGEREIVEAAMRKRQRLLSVYAIYAWRDKVEVPQEYKTGIFKAVRYLSKNVADEKYQYYLAQIHPKLALYHEYVVKLKKIFRIRKS